MDRIIKFIILLSFDVCFVYLEFWTLNIRSGKTKTNRNMVFARN